MILRVLIFINCFSFIYQSYSSSDVCNPYPNLGFYMISTKENVTEYSLLVDVDNIRNFLMNYATCQEETIGFVTISYGYTESFDSESVQDIISAFAERGNYIIFVLDWSDYSGGHYLLDASENAHRIGPIFGNTMWELHHKEQLI